MKLWEIVCIDSTFRSIIVDLSQLGEITSSTGAVTHKEKWEKAMGDYDQECER